jgi:Collagen triple helix repeat (20 copies)
MTVPYIFTGNAIPISRLNANFAAVNAGVNTAGTVTANAQPNIASVGTLTSVSVTGNVRAGAVYTNNYYYANATPFTGTQGPTGPAGAQGPTGVQGTTGAGAQGTVGAQGISGAAVSQGLTGTQGTAGYNGSQGTTGIQGVDGAAGSQGTAGSTGSQGTVGAQGIMGYTGNPGPQGSQGTTGAQGTRGAQGTGGTNGTNGSQGTAGYNGNPGPQGSQGTTGATGAQGISNAGPAFTTTITSATSITASPNSITEYPLIYNSVDKNIGSGYNAVNGIFTTPAAGFYQVSAAFAPGIPSPPANVNLYYGAAALGIYKNNSPIASGPFIEAKSRSWGSVTGWVLDASSVSSLIYLNIGDTLQCKVAYITNYSGFTTLPNLVAPYFQAAWIRS